MCVYVPYTLDCLANSYSFVLLCYSLGFLVSCLEIHLHMLLVMWLWVEANGSFALFVLLSVTAIAFDYVTDLTQQICFETLLHIIGARWDLSKNYK